MRKLCVIEIGNNIGVASEIENNDNEQQMK